MVFNKIDRLNGSRETLNRFLERHPHGVAISADDRRRHSDVAGGTGQRSCARSREFIELSVPHDQPGVIARLHEVGQVIERDYQGETARFKARIPPASPSTSSRRSSCASCRRLEPQKGTRRHEKWFLNRSCRREEAEIVKMARPSASLPRQLRFLRPLPTIFVSSCASFARHVCTFSSPPCGFELNICAMESGMLIKDLPANERPRERLAEKGADALKNAELIAILLRTGLKGVSAVNVAEQLLKKFETLDNLSRAQHRGPAQDQRHRPRQSGDAHGGVHAGAQDGRGIARRIARARQPGSHRSSHARRQPAAPVRNVPGPAAQHAAAPRQSVAAFARHHRHAAGARGEVFSTAIAANAAAVVLVHNHPSGDPTPSEADIKVTRDLIRAGQLLKIEVLDHVIIGRATNERPKDYVSLRELGIFLFLSACGRPSLSASWRSVLPWSGWDLFLRRMPRFSFASAPAGRS